MSFAEILRRWRIEKGYTQQQVANMLFVERTTLVRWEAGTRMPDVKMLAHIAELLRMDMETLLNSEEKDDKKPNVILLDDERIVLTGGMPVLEQSMPDAVISGFERPSAALAFAKSAPVFLAFLDIELGKVSGLDICRALLQINPHTNVVFLTSYIDYSFDAWSTGACGFLLKPLTTEKVNKQLSLLRYPLKGAAPNSYK